jgi:hypothetical protein
LLSVARDLLSPQLRYRLDGLPHRNPGSREPYREGLLRYAIRTSPWFMKRQAGAGELPVNGQRVTDRPSAGCSGGGPDAGSARLNARMVAWFNATGTR